MPATCTNANRYDVICAGCGTEDEPYTVAEYLPGSATINFKSMHDKTFHNGAPVADHRTYTRYDVVCPECHPEGPSLNDDPLPPAEARKMRDDHNALYHATPEDP